MEFVKAMKTHRYKNTKAMFAGMKKHFKNEGCKNILPFEDYQLRLTGFQCKECQAQFVMTITSFRHEFQIPYRFELPNVVTAFRTEQGWIRK